MKKTWKWRVGIGAAVLIIAALFFVNSKLYKGSFPGNYLDLPLLRNDVFLSYHRPAVHLNESFIISFEISRPISKLVVDVFDSRGAFIKNVATFDYFIGPGKKYVVDVSNLASGVYKYRLVGYQQVPNVQGQSNVGPKFKVGEGVFEVLGPELVLNSNESPPTGTPLPPTPAQRTESTTSPASQ